MIYNDIKSLIYEMSNDKFLEIQRLVSWKSLSRANTNADKREEFTIELLNLLDGEKLKYNQLPSNLINYIDRQFIPKLDYIIDFEPAKNLSIGEIKKIIIDFKLLKNNVVNAIGNSANVSESNKLQVDFMSMYIYNILKQHDLDKYQHVEFGRETQDIVSDIISHSKLQFSSSLTSAMDIIRRSETERLAIKSAAEPIQTAASINIPTSVSTPVPTSISTPVSTITPTPISNLIPAPTPILAKELPIDNSLLSKFNIEIPEWVSNISNDKLSILIGGGLVALFGIVSSAYIGTRLFKLIYGKFSNNVNRQLKQKYGIDIILGFTIIDLLFDTWQNPAIQKEFRNNHVAYLNNLYLKYTTLMYIINNLNVGHKSKLIADIRSGEFALLFSDMVVDFQLRHENSNATVSKLLSNPVNSNLQFSKLLD